MLRPATPTDTPALIAVAAATGIFQPNEAEALLGGVLEDLHAGRLGEGHQAHVRDEVSPGWPSGPVGWVYFAPTAKADRVWDLWWIGVTPQAQQRGIGSELLLFVEAQVRAAGGRLLVIETSCLPAFDVVRRFYAGRGYTECGRGPDFYADGDDKAIFAKRITPSNPRS